MCFSLHVHCISASEKPQFGGINTNVHADVSRLFLARCPGEFVFFFPSCFCCVAEKVPFLLCVCFFRNSSSTADCLVPGRRGGHVKLLWRYQLVLVLHFCRVIRGLLSGFLTAELTGCSTQLVFQTFKVMRGGRGCQTRKLPSLCTWSFA